MTRRTQQIRAMENRASMGNRCKTRRRVGRQPARHGLEVAPTTSLVHSFQIGTHHVDAPLYNTSVVVRKDRRFGMPRCRPSRSTRGTQLRSWFPVVHPSRATGQIHPSCVPISRVLETRTGSMPATARENPRCSRQLRAMAGLLRTRPPAGQTHSTGRAGSGLG